MYCTSCGNKIADGAKFCMKCGARADGEESTAAVVAVSTKGFIGRFFGGRIGRLRYFLGALVATLPIFFLVSLWGVIRLFQDTFSAGPTIGLASTLINALIGLLITVTIIFFFVLLEALAIRRCHDFGYSGWWTLCVFVPYIE